MYTNSSTSTHYHHHSAQCFSSRENLWILIFFQSDLTCASRCSNKSDGGHFKLNFSVFSSVSTWCLGAKQRLKVGQAWVLSRGNITFMVLMILDNDLTVNMREDFHKSSLSAHFSFSRDSVIEKFIKPFHVWKLTEVGIRIMHSAYCLLFFGSSRCIMLGGKSRLVILLQKGAKLTQDIGRTLKCKEHCQWFSLIDL